MDILNLVLHIAVYAIAAIMILFCLVGVVARNRPQ
jgi:hypothetical protein